MSKQHIVLGLLGFLPHFVSVTLIQTTFLCAVYLMCCYGSNRVKKKKVSRKKQKFTFNIALVLSGHRCQTQLIQLLWKSANWFNWFSSTRSICKSLTCLSFCSLCSPPQPMLLLLMSIWINIFSVFSDACSVLYLDRHFLLTFQSQPFHAGLCKGSELPELNQSANYVMLCCSLFKWLRPSTINTLSTINIKCVHTEM